MRAREHTTLNVLCAARGFLDEHGRALPLIVESDLPRKLGEIISTISSHARDQVMYRMKAHQYVAALYVLRTALLRDHMASISRIAQADLPHTSAFNVLRMPSGRPTVEQLVSAATAMACAAERFADTFTAAGMHADFVDQLHAAVRALTDARRGATMARASQRGATRGIEMMIAQGNQTLRALDRLIEVELRHDDALLAQWRYVTAKRRLGRPRGRR